MYFLHLLQSIQTTYLNLRFYFGIISRMLSPTPSQERDPKPSPTDCKGFVRVTGSDGKDSELPLTLAGRVVEKK